MKKWIMSAGVMLIIALLFTACGKNEPVSQQTQSASSSNAKEITIQAKNFEFDQKEIHVNKGDTVKVTLKNSQGNHSIKIAGYDKEITAGKTVTFVADKTGEFKMECGIVCGQGHAEMTGKFIVQ
jgi:cytochrome c oxidase subunit 2